MSSRKKHPFRRSGSSSTGGPLATERHADESIKDVKNQIHVTVRRVWLRMLHFRTTKFPESPFSLLWEMRFAQSLGDEIVGSLRQDNDFSIRACNCSDTFEPTNAGGLMLTETNAVATIAVK